MFHCKNLFNLPVLDLSSDEIIGTVGNIYLNRTLKAASYLSVRSAETPIMHNRLIALSQLVAISQSTIIVRTNENADQTLSLGVAARNIYRRHVTSQQHMPIGKVEDVVLDAHGVVIGFWLRSNVTQGALARHPFLKREAISYVGSPTAAMQADLSRSQYFAMTLGQQARRARNTVI